MKIKGKVLIGILYERLNRYLDLVRIKDDIVPCFVPNLERMCELLIHDARGLLKDVLKGGRKTSYDLIGIYKNDQKISIDSRVPDKLLLEA